MCEVSISSTWNSTDNRSFCHLDWGSNAASLIKRAGACGAGHLLWHSHLRGHHRGRHYPACNAVCGRLGHGRIHWLIYSRIHLLLSNGRISPNAHCRIEGLCHHGSNSSKCSTTSFRHSNGRSLLIGVFFAKFCFCVGICLPCLELFNICSNCRRT